MREPFRVLAMDGGGLRGIISARLLVALEELTGARTSRLFDLVVGTSTGGLLALGLTAPSLQSLEPPELLGPGTLLDAAPAHSASDLLDYYSSHAQSIFPDGPAPEVGRNESPSAGVDRELAEHERRGQEGDATDHGRLPNVGPYARYPEAGLDAVLDHYVGDRHLSAALTDLIVPSWDVSRGEPVFFSSRARAKSISRARMRDVGRATTAAPTYFSPMILPEGDLPPRILIDGGVYANNPTLVAYAEGSLLAKDMGRPLALVSLGTGLPPKGSPITPAQWRDQDWQSLVRAILDAALAGSASLNDHVLAQSMRQRGDLLYWRLQPELANCSFAMDDSRTENLACLRALADAFAQEQRVALDEIVATIT